MLITSKGQVTIPLELRNGLGFLPHTAVEFERVGDELRVRKTKDQTRSRRLIEAMAGAGDVKMSTDEIMKLTRE